MHPGTFIHQFVCGRSSARLTFREITADVGARQATPCLLSATSKAARLALLKAGKAK
jgi:hypothetical protein